MLPDVTVRLTSEGPHQLILYCILDPQTKVASALERFRDTLRILGQVLPHCQIDDSDIDGSLQNKAIAKIFEHAHNTLFEIDVEIQRVIENPDAQTIEERIRLEARLEVDIVKTKAMLSTVPL